MDEELSAAALEVQRLANNAQAELDALIDARQQFAALLRQCEVGKAFLPGFFVVAA